MPWKRIVAVVVGLVTGFIVVTIGDTVNHLIHPLPEGTDPTDYAALQVIMEQLPLSAFIGNLISWLLAAFATGAVTGLLDQSNARRNSYFSGGILLLATIANFILLPHPAWLAFVTLLCFLPAVFIGSRLTGQARPAQT